MFSSIKEIFNHSKGKHAFIREYSDSLCLFVDNKMSLDSYRIIPAVKETYMSQPEKYEIDFKCNEEIDKFHIEQLADFFGLKIERLVLDKYILKSILVKENYRITIYK